MSREAPVTRRGVAPGTVLAIASAGAFLAFLDATIVNVAFPEIRRSFAGATVGELSWIFNAYNVVFAAFLVASGRIADLVGRRLVFVGGIGLFTFASVLCGLAPSLEVLIAARALQALGAALLVPASLALVLNAFGPDRRTHAVGLWGAAAALASGLGPPLGGALVELEGWRLTFLVNLPLGVAAIWLARHALVESRAPGVRKMPDLRGSGLLALAVATLTLGIVQGESWGWASPGVLASLAAAAAFSVLVARRVRTHPSPVVHPELLRVRAFAVANVLTMIAGVGFYAYLLNHILFLTTVWEYSVLDAGLAVVPGALAAAATAGTLGRLAERRDPRLLIVPGAALWSLGQLWYVLAAGPRPDFLGEWLPGQIISGVGVGLTLPILGAAAVAAVPGGHYAMASSITSSTRQLGGVIGIALLVLILGTPGPGVFDDGWLLSTICFAVVAAGAPALGRIVRDEVAAPEEPTAATAVPPPQPVLAVQAVEAPDDLDDGPAAMLARAPLLAQMEPRWLERLADRAHTVEVRAGDFLLRAGEPADAMYVVGSGRLEVLKDGEEVVEVLGRGGVVGELGTLSGAPRAADVRARRDSVLLRIAREDLMAALEESPAVARTMLGALAGRLQAAPTESRRETAPVRVLAVVPLERGLQPERLVNALAAELGLTEVLWRCDSLDLERAERTAAHVILAVADDAPATWRDFAARHADRIVALAGPDATPDIELLHPRLRGCELVFRGRRPDRRTLTMWHDLLSPRHATLVRDQPDVARLARRLSGRAVGVVFSGGGARALAHIGVLEELEAHGLVIDRVAGVSMGSIIAGLVAQGRTAAEVDALMYEEFVRRNPMADYRISGRSLLSGQRAATMATRLFGADDLVEELELEFFCTSVDLVSRTLVEHRRGRVREAVGASSVIPGVLPPVASHGRVLVDGGVLNNLPVDLMAARGDGPVIGVDVTQRFDPDLEGAGDTVTDAAGYARIGMRDAIIRSVTLSSLDTEETARDHADLVIRPDSAGAGMFEFHQIDTLREAGRAAAREALAAWTVAPQPVSGRFTRVASGPWRTPTSSS